MSKEPCKVEDLRPGCRVPMVRVVRTVMFEGDQVTVAYEDGLVETHAVGDSLVDVEHP